MSALEKRYRRNFIVAVVMHVTAIGGFVFFEQFLSNGGRPAMASVELFTPADILGDMPKGEGAGRGAYKAPEPAGGEPAPAPSQFTATPDETPAPTPSKVSLPGEIAVPKKNAPANTKTAAPPVVAKKPAVATTTTKPKSTTGKGTNTEDIKNRFAKALGSSAGGTSRGDGKTAGGGSGKGPIGSPTGAKDGIVGGVGQGSPNWRYFEHVHDVMYEAWSQSGTALDKKYVATVMLKIARDGSIVDASLRIPSGSKPMDDSVMSAVRKVPRLEPPPGDLLRGEFANVSVDFQVEG